jgi:uncharacterized Ntn-hydrolase superfamily protein
MWAAAEPLLGDGVSSDVQARALLEAADAAGAAQPGQARNHADQAVQRLRTLGDRDGGMEKFVELWVYLSATPLFGLTATIAITRTTVVTAAKSLRRQSQRYSGGDNKAKPDPGFRS